jgi:hypothetical protein
MNHQKEGRKQHENDEEKTIFANTSIPYNLLVIEMAS